MTNLQVLQFFRLKFNSTPSLSLDVVAISRIFAEEDRPSAGAMKIDVEMEAREENVEIVLTSPPENDFVNFQLGELRISMFNVGRLHESKQLCNFG